MLYDLKESIINFIRSRIFVLYILVLVVSFVLMRRIFVLQIVKGEDYKKNFILTSEKNVEIRSSRGNIYDRNGELLAYNELAYMVTITDVIESGSDKNQKLNSIIHKMVKLIHDNGDSIDCDFGIYLDENDNYCFSLSDSALLRFLADIYGYSSVNDLLYEEKESNPQDVVEYLISSKKYAIGSTFNTDNGTEFVPGMGYSKSEILDIIKIRYNLGLNGYQKYISTIVSNDVSDETVAVILENSDTLLGVSIEETTLRKYNNSIYFSPLIGYTGKISQVEFDEYSKTNDNYSLNDYVGKTGIEFSMEDKLQGIKGSQTVYVDNLGKIIETKNVIKPVAGNDVYLTIDAGLQKATYNLLEQKIAGILVSKIENAKTIDQTGRNRKIPIYDVYYALINNNVINLNHMSKEYASSSEKAVYNAYNNKLSNVCDKLKTNVLYSDVPYKDLSEEYQVYESFIINMLSSDNNKVIITSSIDQQDEVYNDWKVRENISIKEFLLYAISKQWIDIGKLNIDAKYADSKEIYDALVTYIIEHLHNNNDFAKKLYKYMLLNDDITGKQLCLILWEQDIIQVDSSEISQLKNGVISDYSFMVNLISNIKIRPSSLGLEPCSGSCVITDPYTGEVLALVSYPGYDNNQLANKANADYLAKLNSDMSKPLWNYATQQRTAPGSTFKMVTSVAGTMEGVISPGSQITCTGIFDKLNGTVHKCWISPGSHGVMTLSSAIANSCNNYFYEVGYRLANDGTGYNDTYGIERLSKYVDLFGLSDKSGVEITESEPMVSDQYPVPSAIGQGTHSYTTVGLARYVTAVANNGTVYDLTLINSIKEADGTAIYTSVPKIRNQIVLDPSLWNSIHSGMKQVVENKAYFAKINLSAAGKTGTAQEATNKPNHALFVGYAPYDNPRIAIAVRIANGYSSDYAAQVSRDVFMYYFNLVEEEELINGVASEANGTTNGD